MLQFILTDSVKEVSKTIKNLFQFIRVPLSCSLLCWRSSIYTNIAIDSFTWGQVVLMYNQSLNPSDSAFFKVEKISCFVSSGTQMSHSVSTIVMYAAVDLFELILLEFVELLRRVIFFPSLSPISLSLNYWDSCYAYVNILNCVPLVSDMLFIFFIVFSFCSSDWIISVDLFKS